jgi:hypothetical protein
MEQVVNNFIVHGPAELGMRVQDQCDGRLRCVGLVMVAAFKPAFWTNDVDFWHSSSKRLAHIAVLN